MGQAEMNCNIWAGLQLPKRRQAAALQIRPRRGWVGAGRGVGGLAQGGVGGWVAILRRGGWGGKFPSVGLHKSFIYRLLL